MFWRQIVTLLKRGYRLARQKLGISITEHNMILNIAPWVRCIYCSAPINIRPTWFEDYFRGEMISCPKCNKDLDWWHVALREITDNFMLSQAFSLLGCPSTAFQINLAPNQRTCYRFSDYCIPADANILYVNYTGSGNMHPIEIRGNVATLDNRTDQVCVWPVRAEESQAMEETSANVFVTWVKHSALDTSWKNIVESYRSYADDNYQAAVIPANVAAESSLAIVLNDYLPTQVGKKWSIEFLKDAATYGYQLNVVMPLIAKLCDLPSLSDDIRGLLNRLRNVRNELAHTGKIEAPFTQESCAKLICAALFGLQFFQFIGKQLKEADT